MKRLFTLILLCLSISSFGQKDNNKYDFFGGKKYKNKSGDISFFRIAFQIKDNDSIAGFMYTGNQLFNEKKSSIVGFLDKKTKYLYISETKKHQVSSGSCYIKGRLIVKLEPKENLLLGAFNEVTKSGNECTKGTFFLISPDSYIRLKRILDKYDEEHREVNRLTITERDKLTLKWKSDTIKLVIWDDQQEDDDRISILHNDDVILNNYGLKNKKKVIEVPFKGNECTIEFFANSTGLVLNNTASVDLYDDAIKHQIITELDLNKSVIVTFKKQ